MLYGVPITPVMSYCMAKAFPLIKLSPGTRIFYLVWVIKFNVIYFWFRYNIIEEGLPTIFTIVLWKHCMLEKG